MTSAFESAENRSITGNVLKEYPHASETLITNEIQLLE